MSAEITDDDLLNAILHALGLSNEEGCIEDTELVLKLKCVNGKWKLVGEVPPEAAGKSNLCKPRGKKGRKP